MSHGLHQNESEVARLNRELEERVKRRTAQRKEAQWRHCRINGRPLKEVAVWAERYRHMWEERLDRLDQYLQHVKTKEEKRHGRQPRRK